MPWYHGWNVLAVAMLFQAVTFGVGIYSFTFWVAPWSAEFTVGRSEVMTVFITLQVAMGLLSPLAGRAVDRLSLRGPLIIAGALCLAAGLLLAGRAGALWHLNLVYGTLIVAGLLLAGPLAGQTLAARWFARRRGTALGVVTIGTSIGGFLAPPLVTALHAEIGWRAANDWLALIVVLLIVPPVWLLVRNAPSAGLRAVEGTGGDAHRDGGSTPSTATLDILRQRVFWLTVLAFTPLATAFGGAQQNLGPYASDLGIDAQSAAYLVSVMALVMIAAKIFFGAMADRWDIRALFLLTVVGLGLALGLMLLELSYFALVLVCGPARLRRRRIPAAARRPSKPELRHPHLRPSDGDDRPVHHPGSGGPLDCRLPARHHRQLRPGLAGPKRPAGAQRRRHLPTQAALGLEGQQTFEGGTPSLQTSFDVSLGARASRPRTGGRVAEHRFSANSRKVLRDRGSVRKAASVATAWAWLGRR